VAQRLALPFGALLVLSACDLGGGDLPSLARRAADHSLALGEHRPSRSEAETVGALSAPVARGSASFAALARCDAPGVVFKDEERSGADRHMTPRLCAALTRLSRLVGAEWPGVELRVTEAWDDRGEHGPTSLHYEGRAADLTTSDRDAGKLGRLGRLAVDAGLDWVLFEDASHVHVSVARGRPPRAW